jgi:hypothetical protein
MSVRALLLVLASSLAACAPPPAPAGSPANAPAVARPSRLDALGERRVDLARQRTANLRLQFEAGKLTLVELVAAYREVAFAARDSGLRGEPLRRALVEYRGLLDQLRDAQRELTRARGWTDPRSVDALEYASAEADYWLAEAGIPFNAPDPRPVERGSDDGRVVQGKNVWGSGTSGALRGTLYFIPETTTALPDFATLKPVATLYTDVLDIPDHDFQGGFPGVTEHDEWFAIQYEGVFTVRVAGQYGFRTESDDGSRVFVDGRLVLDNDGIHGIRSVAGSASLDAGKHQIRVDYFQGPRYRVALRLLCTPPGQGERLWGPAL